MGYKFLAILFFSTVAKAQLTSSSLNGVVTDGEIPAQVEVHLIFTPTNSSFDTVTDKYGRFSFDNLDVGGPYTIVVKGKEFEEFKRTGLQLSLGENDLPRKLIIKRKG
jgi:hypothetical protein